MVAVVGIEPTSKVFRTSANPSQLNRHKKSPLKKVGLSFWVNHALFTLNHSLENYAIKCSVLQIVILI